MRMEMMQAERISARMKESWGRVVEPRDTYLFTQPQPPLNSQNLLMAAGGTQRRTNKQGVWWQVTQSLLIRKCFPGSTDNWTAN